MIITIRPGAVADAQDSAGGDVRFKPGHNRRGFRVLDGSVTVSRVGFPRVFKRPQTVPDMPQRPKSNCSS